ncbi:Gfo/Idh/MocA family protein [Prochlorothrix hollandica]|uniref:Oxidoreductase n=1 Tax=Prochlorothrix hollandica PCC 9006 = CALU 1027 TaxID=317619 RepID=A0A0M2PSC2_PROHO|nr:Gfo/Idh/MocA family oxidoreductase [Prochlorothrix hollandica]KKI98062.1 oxidoreductase [Prochlorothrix hollandica PCC 9006 = CALU 1027]
MPDSPLRAAVIGTGAISKEHLSFLQHSSRVDLVGVCDLSQAAARYAADRFQAQKAYTDYQQMLAETQPDVVHILTPPQTHKAIATHCLQAKTHVLCEKPIAPTYGEFQELVAVARAAERYLIEDYNYLFNEPILALQRAIAQGELGDIEEVEVRMALDIRQGGRFADENLPNPVHQLPAGVIHDVLTHLCYLLVPYLPRIDRIAAAWSNHGGGDLFKFDDLDALIIGDQVHGRLRFSCYTQPDCFEVKIRGSQGYGETDLFQPYVRIVKPRSGGKQLTPLINHWVTGTTFLKASVVNFRNKVLQKTPYEGLHRFLDLTYQALEQGQPPPVSLELMDRTNALIQQLLEERYRL